MVERRVAAGEAAAPELLLMRSELAKAAASVVAMEGKVEQDRAVLCEALGVSGRALGEIRLDPTALDLLPEEAAVAPPEARRAALTNRLDVRRALSDYEAAEAALRLEVARQYPDVRLGPGYEYDQGQNKYAIGVSVELPILNQNRGPIAEAQASRREAAGRFEQVQARALAQVEQAVAGFGGAAAEVEQARQQETAASQRLTTTQRAVALGQRDRLDLEGERVAVIQAAQARWAAQRKAQIALGTLEDALQRPWDAAEHETQTPAKELQ
jgi:outer membrane protein TolC